MAVVENTQQSLGSRFAETPVQTSLELLGEMLKAVPQRRAAAPSARYGLLHRYQHLYRLQSLRSSLQTMEPVARDHTILERHEL